MKKVLSAVIALTAVAAMSVSAFADDIDLGQSNGTKTDKVQDGALKTSVATIEGGLADGTEVTVTVSKVDTVDKDAEDAVAAKAGEGTTLNTVITITTDATVDGEATVTVAYDGKSNKVAYVSDDKTNVELMDLTVTEDGKFASFKTTHFSTFYLVTVAENGTPGTDKDDDKTNPGTGVVLAIVPAAVAAAAVVVSKKRK